LISTSGIPSFATPTPGNLTLVAVVGLRREARIVAGPGLVVVTAGAQGADVEAAVRAALADGVRGVLSMGLAGALHPALRPGDIIVGADVFVDGRVIGSDPAWRRRLMEALPQARTGGVAHVEVPLADASAKRRLFQASGAHIVDMESGAAAKAAADAGVPFMVLRAVSDGADRTLPKAATAGFGADGSMDILAVLGALMRRPFDLPALVRTGVEAEAGFRSLLRCRRRLGPTFGFADV
jgi:hopanoid-associated phosphorylase